MSLWYQATIRYQQPDDKGKNKAITETYLLDAVSYTDAEARIYGAVASNLADFHLSKLSRMRLNDVYFVEEGAETWFKLKVLFVTFDEKAQKDKKVPYNMLINAANPREAYDLLAERLGKVVDYEITDVNITNILEVIPYEKDAANPLEGGNFRPLAEVQAAQESREA